MEQCIMEPYDLYIKELKEKHNKNVCDFIENLTKESNVNIQENEQTIKSYNKTNKEIKKLQGKASRLKGLRTFIIVLLVIAPIVGGLMVYFNYEAKNMYFTIGICVLVAWLVILILSIVLIKKKINPKLRSYREQIEALSEEAQKLLNQAWAQMDPLNDLFDWNVSAKLVTKTVPIIKMDQYFDSEKYQFLNKKYGLMPNDDPSVSTYFVQSGAIKGNPFILCRDFKRIFVDHEYSNSITISWRERTVVNGKSRMVTRTQVLTASISKPKPKYYYETYLVYGNGAAPNLTFSRYPVVRLEDDEKDINKYVKKNLKKLDELEREAIEKGKSYTRLGNDEFEVLFDGTNRNDEIEYRLLFTPLAQKNILSVLKNDVPYGDDFAFIKDKELNYIKSKHAQEQDIYADPRYYMGYDYKEIKKKFIDYNNKYFESFYFDLVPLLSIPLYQQHKPKEYIYGEFDDYQAKLSPYEHEAIVNAFKSDLLAHPDSKTSAILKTRFVKNDKDMDEVVVTAHSFRTEQRVEYVSRLGGDGRLHTIPVYWDEYIPIEQDTKVVITPKTATHNQYSELVKTPEFVALMADISVNGGCLFERGLVASIISKELNEEQLAKFNNMFNNLSNNTSTSTSESKSVSESNSVTIEKE